MIVPRTTGAGRNQSERSSAISRNAIVRAGSMRIKMSARWPGPRALPATRAQRMFAALARYVQAPAGQVKLMMTDLIWVKRSRPYGPFSRPQPLCLKPPQGEALSKAL
jgi:hypothetical protein